MEINGVRLVIPEGGSGNTGADIKRRRANFTILKGPREQFRTERDGSPLIRLKINGLD